MLPDNFFFKFNHKLESGFLYLSDQDPEVNSRKNGTRDIEPLKKPDPKKKKLDPRTNRTLDTGPLTETDSKYQKTDPR